MTALVGLSAWSDVEGLYPPGTKPADRLRAYAEWFPVVEVNTTAYHVPPPRTVAGWLERTPPGFRFDVKPPRALTGTPERPGGAAPEPDADLAARFAASVRPIAEAGRLGALTFQFPPSHRNSEGHRDHLRLLPELFPGLPLAVEFRRRDWLDDEHADGTLALLREAGLSHTMADEPQVGSGSVPPVPGVTNPDVAIVRFHGRNAETWYRFTGPGQGRFDWDDAPAELAEWVPRIERVAAAAREVHLLLNTNSRPLQGPCSAFLLMDLLGLPTPTRPPRRRRRQPTSARERTDRTHRRHRMGIRIGSVVVDCHADDLDRLVAFWTAALGYPVADYTPRDWARLDDPAGRANLSFQVIPDPTPGKNKLHLDLYTDDQRGEVERLLALGATVRRWPEPGDDFVGLRDPAGNNFCVVQKD